MTPEEKILDLVTGGSDATSYQQGAQMLGLLTKALGAVVRKLTPDQRQNLAGVIVQQLGGTAVVRQTYGVSLGPTFDRADNTFAGKDNVAQQALALVGDLAASSPALAAVVAPATAPQGRADLAALVDRVNDLAKGWKK